MTSAFSIPDRDEADMEREAAEWVLLLSQRPLSSEENGRFSEWRAANPRHGQLFAGMSRTWSDLDQCEISHAVTPNHVFARRQNLFVYAGLAIAATVAIFMFAPQYLGSFQVYSTAVGETRPISLADGSVVTLGADSRIKVHLGQTQRRVVLESGEAFFEVAHDEAKPFHVEAGGAEVRVVGTKFDVNRADNHVSIMVLEGVVQVKEAPLVNIGAAEQPQILTAGQRVELTPNALLATAQSAVAHVSRVSTVPGAWRDGRLNYDNASLGELVADLNRYYAPGVRLDRSELAQLRVTASFRTDEVVGILDVLEHALPIEIVKSEQGTFTIHAAQKPVSARN